MPTKVDTFAFTIMSEPHTNYDLVQTYRMTSYSINQLSSKIKQVKMCLPLDGFILTISECERQHIKLRELLFCIPLYDIYAIKSVLKKDKNPTSPYGLEIFYNVGSKQARKVNISFRQEKIRDKWKLEMEEVIAFGGNTGMAEQFHSTFNSTTNTNNNNNYNYNNSSNKSNNKNNKNNNNDNTHQSIRSDSDSTNNNCWKICPPGYEDADINNANTNIGEGEEKQRYLGIMVHKKKYEILLMF